MRVMLLDEPGGGKIAAQNYLADHWRMETYFLSDSLDEAASGDAKQCRLERLHGIELSRLGVSRRVLVCDIAYMSEWQSLHKLGFFPIRVITPPLDGPQGWLDMVRRLNYQFSMKELPGYEVTADCSIEDLHAQLDEVMHYVRRGVRFIAI
jgi:hypothetical protein